MKGEQTSFTNGMEPNQPPTLPVLLSQAMERNISPESLAQMLAIYKEWDALEAKKE